VLITSQARCPFSSAVVRVGLLIALLLLGAPPAVAQADRAVPVLHIDGVVGPAMSDYIVRGLAAAADDGAPMIVIQMDTPGGLDGSMREIIRGILRSPVPVITYVAPSGSRAASAGTFILLASHVAAMAPGTNVGAASPVQIGGGMPQSPQEKGGDGKNAEPESASTSEAKAMNDAIAYIRSLAELRERNADWAEAAVRTADSLSATGALEKNVIDLVARDRTHLLAQLGGRTVTAGGKQVRLDTRDVRLVDTEPNWRTRVLGAITNPNIALILMMIGIYGLLFEFMNPGALYPGVIGGICLLVGLYALAALPVNYAGIALILLGIALMAGEAFAPSFGILGIGGIAAFVLGAAIMVDTDVPQFRVGWPVIAAAALVSLAVMLAVARLALTSHRRKVVSGREQLIGATGNILDWENGRGHVFVHGERWMAEGVRELSTGQPVQVVRLEDLTLTVEPTATRR
jgi:membrane-bound serine protease (ClpP class)